MKQLRSIQESISTKSLIHEAAKALAKEKGIEFEERHKKGDILSLFFEEYAEEKLIQPTFIIDHPIEISPLTKKIPGNPELYREIRIIRCMVVSLQMHIQSLMIRLDQRERFEAQEALLRQRVMMKLSQSDEDFLNALAYGMPPTGGVGYRYRQTCVCFLQMKLLSETYFYSRQ